MSIKPKLYLNMSPQTAEDNSLAFAKNMKIDNDGNLINDYGATHIQMDDYDIVGHIVGLDDIVYFFGTKEVTEDDVTTIESCILEYNELTKTYVELNTGWTYSGGSITGFVNTNITGEKILTIAESLDGVLIPLKHINLSHCTSSDNESLYTQTPEIPIANLTLNDTYIETIPNGVYVYFIRYKIREGVYTNWQLCSRPIFGGTAEKMNTVQGGLKYIDLHKDSARSFIFDISFLNSSAKSNYSEFQIGFIITHDEATEARIWKSFPMNTTKIYFDYDGVEETNIDDLLETTYGLHNVKNVTSFKNKLYISNYKESNFNPTDVSEILDCIHLDKSYVTGNIDVYKDIKFNNVTLKYNNSLGYFDKDSNDNTISSIANTLIDASCFDFDISNFSKLDTIEIDNCANFYLKWSHTYNPDIAAIYNIYNTLYGGAKFGETTDITYEQPSGLSTPWAAQIDLTHVGGWYGITLVDYSYNNDNSTDIWIFAPTNSPHPWLNKGLTFAYSSSALQDVSIARNGVFMFKLNTNNYNIAGHNITGFPARNLGFDDAARTTIDENIKKEIKNLSSFQDLYIEITSGTKVYKIGYKDEFDLDTYAGWSFDTNNILSQDGYAFSISYANSNNSQSTTISNSIKNKVLNTIKSHLVGIGTNGNIILSIDGETVNVSTMSVIFKKFEYECESQELLNDIDNIQTKYIVNLKTTTYTVLCNIKIKDNKITAILENNSTYSQDTTLMPFSTYQPYVHFVTKHGVITNGIKLANTIETFDNGGIPSDLIKIKLKYTIDSLANTNLANTDYIAWFVSLENVGNLIIETFNYVKQNSRNIVNCIELDTLLYNISDNIELIDEQGQTITIKAKYYSSNVSNPSIAFGNCGFVMWDSLTDYSNTKLYIKITRNKNNNSVKRLQKATPYLPLETDTNVVVNDGNYGSYLCLVKKPDYYLSSSCYAVGGQLYAINRGSSLSLTDFNNYIQLQDTTTFIVLSNFNLNYLSLSEDIQDTLFSVGNASSGVKQVTKIINSPTLSYVYELKSMYKDFMNKLFSEYNSNINITEFNNTIRVSTVLSDESSNNQIFKFISTDYYNIPSDRGIIIKLFTIANQIFAHTKNSLYKFNATQTIVGTDKDIKLQEAEPFDLGIEQVFDSQYGYGGLYNKEASCITYDSYIFYDYSKNHIFAYSGNGQVNIIDSSIYTLLSYYKAKICNTIHDEKNNRILFEFVIDNSNYNICISYNYKSKSFVSLHDLTLNKAFNSKNCIYSYHNKVYTLFDSNIIDTIKLDNDINLFNLFGGASSYSDIRLGDEDYRIQESPFSVSVIMFPKQYNLEILNSITISAHKILSSIVNHNAGANNTKTIKNIDLPQLSDNNPIDSIYIITDRCLSNKITGTINDIQRVNSLMHYKEIKFNLGEWNTNYFRNKLNADDIFDYTDAITPDDQVHSHEERNPYNDNNSLIYGRYFIINIEFNKTIDSKIENIFINTSKFE